jgi:uncharacterized protein with GYD domain
LVLDIAAYRCGSSDVCRAPARLPAGREIKFLRAIGRSHMPKYMVAASYTAEGLKGLQKDKASGRRAAVQKVVEGLGGKVEAMYFALGDHDVIVIVDLPNTVAASALALGVSASGLVRTKTTALLSVEETDQALGKKLDYSPPGR